MSASSTIKVTFRCETCGKQVTRFKRLDSKNRFCSRRCTGNAYIERYGRYDRQREKNPMWKGGIRYASGYRFILQPSHPRSNKRGYVQEHRLVMETNLGRFLTPKEKVHHINGVKDDNRIENLIVMTNQSEHIKRHLYEGTLNNTYWKGRKRSLTTRQKMAESGRKAWEIRKSLA